MKPRNVNVKIEAARLGLLAAALACAAVGLAGGEYGEVMEKAVRICLECIGIG